MEGPMRREKMKRREKKGRGWTERKGSGTVRKGGRTGRKGVGRREMGVGRREMGQYGDKRG